MKKREHEKEDSTLEKGQQQEEKEGELEITWRGYPIKWAIWVGFARNGCLSFTFPVYERVTKFELEIAQSFFFLGGEGGRGGGWDKK